MENLTNFTIYQTLTDRLTLDQFERIVRSRFIPTSGQRESKNKYPSLTILVHPDIKPEDMEWQASELLISTIRSVSTVNRWDHNWLSYCFSWSADSS